VYTEELIVYYGRQREGIENLHKLRRTPARSICASLADSLLSVRIEAEPRDHLHSSLNVKKEVRCRL
jgi:hypothetical protein